MSSTELMNFSISPIDFFDEGIYSKSGSFLGGGSTEETLAQKFFMEESRVLAAKEKKSFSETAFNHLFDLLIELGFTVKEMIQQLPEIIKSWCEKPAKDVLHLLGIDGDQTNEKEGIVNAIKILKNSDGLFFGEGYDLDDGYYILYNTI